MTMIDFLNYLIDCLSSVLTGFSDYWFILLAFFVLCTIPCIIRSFVRFK